MSLLDIRIGTLMPIDKAASHIPQILHHGFESFQLTGGWGVGSVDFQRIAGEVRTAIEGKAVISSIGYFGNPLLKPDDAKLFGEYIDNAHLFGCDVVAGFAGALDGKPVMDSMPVFKRVWGDLTKRAKDKGLKIAFENCDMQGWWTSARYNVAHSPTFWEAMWNEVPGDNLGICWEPCHQMVSLIDPIPQLRKYIKKVFTMHGKDATIDWHTLRESGLRGGKQYVYHRTPGFGDTNWTDVISVLRQGGFKGCIDIEGWHDPVYRNELEMTGQVHALNYLKQCRGGSVFAPNPV
ncbi:MAG: sugar phosphate isomerase/epimerase [Burkholderiales bacterium]|nr:sugar phosphate isomerase/epimerase [Phycisphaerae bacterium]